MLPTPLPNSALSRAAGYGGQQCQFDGDVLAQIQVAAQPDTGLTWVMRGAVGGGGGPPGGERLLKGEGGVVVGGRDVDDDQTRQRPPLVLTLRSQQELPRFLGTGSVPVLLLPAGSLTRLLPRLGQQRRVRPVHLLNQPRHVSRNRPHLTGTGQHSSGPQQQMTPVDHLAGKRECRVTALTRLEPRNEQPWHAQSVRAPSVLVPVQPSYTLQQKINKGQIRDQ